MFHYGHLLISILADFSSSYIDCHWYICKTNYNWNNLIRKVTCIYEIYTFS